MSSEWVHGPLGLDAAKGTTWRPVRTVLIVVHHLVAWTRLADVVPLLETDRRIQVLYTVAPSPVFGRGVADHLRRLGCLVIGWTQACNERFDLALAAAFGSLERLHAPVVTLPHGVGYGRYTPRWDGSGEQAPRPLTGATRERLLAYGRVVPSAVLLAHEDHRDRLVADCPEAASAVVVTGDPTFDRLRASLPHRAAYRDALGAGPGQRLVVVSSTWSPGSLAGRDPELPARLVAELDGRDHRVAAILHPNIWIMHGYRQVRSWYDACTRAGLRLLPPEEGWRAALVAADVVLGDHGSVTYYAAALGRPLLLGTFPDDDVQPDTHVALLGRLAPRLDAHRPVRAQLDAAIEQYAPLRYTRLRALASSVPGQAARLIRRTLYRLMALPEPADPAFALPVPAPAPLVALREAA